MMLITIAISGTIGFLFGVVATVVALQPTLPAPIDDVALGIGAPARADMPWIYRHD